MGTHKTSLLIDNHRARRENLALCANKIPLKSTGESVYYIGKTLELMGIACLGAGLYLGCVNPYGYSESKAMGVEMGFLTLGVLVFFVGRLIEKRQ